MMGQSESGKRFKGHTRYDVQTFPLALSVRVFMLEIDTIRI